MAASTSLVPFKPFLDHIVILIPHEALSSPPSWLISEFTILPGGYHSDGLTENTLIIFQDGTYLELIAFLPSVDPEKRRRHRWGKHPEWTIIDWAYTLPHESEFEEVRQRLLDGSTGVVYDAPIPGGRTRPDAKVLKWAVAIPRATTDDIKARVGSGEIPFWCLDRTPRELRVPYDKEAITHHECGAIGVSSLTLAVDDEKLKAAYFAIHERNGTNIQTNDATDQWDFNVPLRSHQGPRRLIVAIDSQEPTIRLTLYTKATSRRIIGGHPSSGARILIDLVPVSSGA